MLPFSHLYKQHFKSPIPTTADMNLISCPGAQVKPFTYILILQFGKFRTRIMGQSMLKDWHLILPFWQQKLGSTCYSYRTQIFCFWFSQPSEGVMFQHEQKKMNIIFMENTILLL